MEAFTEIVAKWGGECPACKKPYDKGERVVWISRGQAAHLKCTDQLFYQFSSKDAKTTWGHAPFATVDMALSRALELSTEHKQAVVVNRVIGDGTAKAVCLVHAAAGTVVVAPVAPAPIVAPKPAPLVPWDQEESPF